MIAPSMTVRAAAGIGALVFVLAACGGGESVATDQKIDAEPAAFVVSPDQAKDLVPTPTEIPSPRATATPGVVVPTTFARPERTQGPPGNPVAQNFSNPPSVGRYPFRVIAQGSFGQQETEFEIEYRDPKAAFGGKSQLELWHIPGFEQEFTYLWGSDSLRLQRLKSKQFDGTTVECEFDPPSLVYKLPMSVGSNWSSTSECDGEKGTSTSEVIRTEIVDIGGSSVDTFVVRSVTKSGQTKTTTMSWYAPGPRLVVILESDTEDPELGSIKTTIEALSISPATA